MIEVPRYKARRLAASIRDAVSKCGRDAAPATPWVHLTEDMKIAAPARFDLFEFLQIEHDVYIHDFTVNTPLAIYRAIRCGIKR